MTFSDSLFDVNNERKCIIPSMWYFRSCIIFEICYTVFKFEFCWFFGGNVKVSVLVTLLIWLLNYYGYWVLNNCEHGVMMWFYAWYDICSDMFIVEYFSNTNSVYFSELDNRSEYVACPKVFFLGIYCFISCFSKSFSALHQITLSFLWCVIVIYFF